MNSNNSIIAEEIKDLLKNIIKNFKGKITGHISGYGFTIPQLQLLQVLYNHPDITLKELSTHLGLAKSTVSDIVDRLEAQGAVIRVRSTEDRRTVRISLSPKSCEIEESIKILKMNYLAEILHSASNEEVEKILEGLKLLNSLMEKKRSDGNV